MSRVLAALAFGRMRFLGGGWRNGRAGRRRCCRRTSLGFAALAFALSLEALGFDDVGHGWQVGVAAFGSIVELHFLELSHALFLLNAGAFLVAVEAGLVSGCCVNVVQSRTGPSGLAADIAGQKDGLVLVGADRAE